MTEIEIIDVPTIKREVKIEKATHHKFLNQVKEEEQISSCRKYNNASNMDECKKRANGKLRVDFYRTSKTLQAV